MKFLPALLAMAIGLTAHAADPKAALATPTSAATINKIPKRYPFHANVAAVDIKAKTITLVGKKKQRVLYITPATRVTKDKKPVALDTIKIGEYITGSLLDTDGHLEPTTVNVGGTQKPTAQTPTASTPSAQAPAAAPQQSASIKVIKPNSSLPKK